MSNTCLHDSVCWMSRLSLSNTIHIFQFHSSTPKIHLSFLSLSISLSPVPTVSCKLIHLVRRPYSSVSLFRFTLQLAPTLDPISSFFFILSFPRTFFSSYPFREKQSKTQWNEQSCYCIAYFLTYFHLFAFQHVSAAVVDILSLSFSSLLS